MIKLLVQVQLNRRIYHAFLLQMNRARFVYFLKGRKDIITASIEILGGKTKKNDN